MLVPESYRDPPIVLIPELCKLISTSKRSLNISELWKSAYKLVGPSLASQVRLRDKMNVTYDEYGRPFIILREQANKRRVKGLEAQKVRELLQTHSFC